MPGRRESLRELIDKQHEEFMRDQDRREEKSEREFRRRDEEFREFMRVTTLRHEKIYGPVIVEMEEASAQIRANTEAVLSMLDKFDSK